MATKKYFYKGEKIMKKISVVVKRAGAEADVMQIKPELESFQSLVEGYIEGVTPTEYLAEHNIVAYCNDEGKLNGLIPNLFFPEIKDVIFGTCVFVKADDEGDDISMEQDEIEYVLKLCEERSVPIGVTALDLLKLIDF